MLRGAIAWSCPFSLCILVLFHFAILGSAAPAAAQEEKAIKLGILLDSDDTQLMDLWRVTRQEVEALLGNAYRLQEPRVLTGDWSRERVVGHYQNLLADDSIDAIVSLGVLSCTVIADQKTYPKPVILMGIYDPVIQGLAEERRPTSGIENLSYLLEAKTLTDALAFFREVMPFKKVAMLFGQELVTSLDSQNAAQIAATISEITDDLAGVELQVVLVGDDPQATVAAIEADVDAAFLGFFPRLGEAKTQQLISGLNQRGLPSFGTDLDMLELGAMVSSATETDISKLARRIALNLEAILAGEPAADLPVLLDFEERLTLNWRTVTQLKFAVRWDVLTRAEIINDDFLTQGRSLDLETVMAEALEANLALQAEEQAVAAGTQDVAIARSSLRPDLSLGTTGIQIDKDRAEASFGSNPERTLSSNLSLQQLLYSEQALANVNIQNNLLAATEYGRDQVALDAVLDTGKSYLNVLRAKALVSIRKQSLLLSRRNLETAKLR